MSAPDSAPVPAGDEAPTITVVTLNLLHGAPLPGKGKARVSIVERLEHVAARLEALAPDVILLQEASRGARHDVTAAILARRLGMDWVYAPANPAWIWGFAKLVMRLVPNLEFEEGPAVLSRLPILERHVHRLSSRLPTFEQRIAVEAVLGGPRGPFSVFSVHLSAFSNAGRRRQAAALLRAVGSSPHHHPTIVGGDFNAEEHAREVRLLTRGRGWLDTFREVHPGEPGYTSPQALDAVATTASRRIDFLFSVPAGAERWRPHDARLVLDGALPSTADGVLWASDHYGVLAQLTLERARDPASCTASSADRPRAAGTGDAPRPERLLDWQLDPALRARAVALVGDAASRAPGDDWRTLADDVRVRHAGDVRAVIGYGSWFTPGLRKQSSFPDLYVVVHDCTRFHGARLRGLVNRWLPPDVGYRWLREDDRMLLAGKVNVLDAQQLARECGTGLRDLYNAGRLSKLVWIAWAESDGLRGWLVDRIVDANQTLAALVIGLLPQRFTTRSFSHELLAASYRAEARLEGWERIRALRDAHAAYYDALHPLLLEGFAAASGGLLVRRGDAWVKQPDPAWRELAARARRIVRRSRARGWMRWVRIVATEPNLADLAANEALRKAGVRVRLTPRLRRHPLLLGLPEFVRVLRERDPHTPIGPPRG